jgi:hypothetical protein
MPCGNVSPPWLITFVIVPVIQQAEFLAKTDGMRRPVSERDAVRSQPLTPSRPVNLTAKRRRIEAATTALIQQTSGDNVMPRLGEG